MTYTLLLSVHVAAGITALISAGIAVLMPKGGRGHAYAGRTFVIGMAVIFATAIPMTILRSNLFLFLVAIFSFYQALTGWLRARNRSGVPTVIEWAAAGIMASTALAMGLRGGAMLVNGDSMGIVMLVFGGIGGVLVRRDLVSMRARRYTGTHRIVAHMTRMLGGAIATVTAVVVVNVQLEPAFAVWIGPAAAFTPIVMYWRARRRRASGVAGR